MGLEEGQNIKRRPFLPKIISTSQQSRIGYSVEAQNFRNQFSGVKQKTINSFCWGVKNMTTGRARLDNQAITTEVLVATD